MSMTLKFRTADGQLLDIDMDTVQSHPLIIGDTTSPVRDEQVDPTYAGHEAFTSVSAMGATNIVDRLMRTNKTSLISKKHEPRGYSKPTPWPAR
jgi:hypothetical protein